MSAQLNSALTTPRGDRREGTPLATPRKAVFGEMEIVKELSARGLRRASASASRPRMQALGGILGRGSVYSHVCNFMSPGAKSALHT